MDMRACVHRWDLGEDTEEILHARAQKCETRVDAERMFALTVSTLFPRTTVHMHLCERRMMG